MSNVKINWEINNRLAKMNSVFGRLYQTPEGYYDQHVQSHNIYHSLMYLRVMGYLLPFCMIP